MTDNVLIVQIMVDAMRKVNEVEKKSLTYDDFWRDIATAAQQALYDNGYKILKLTPLYTGTPQEAARECAGNE